MNCDLVIKNIDLYIYGELPDDARYELDQHVSRCRECEAALASAREFHATLSSFVREPAEPSPSFLAASRMRLQEALENTEQSGFLNRWALDLTGWMHQIKLAPALTLALLMVGFGAGTLTTFKINSTFFPQSHASDASIKNASEASIAGIRDITPDPSSNRVEIKYDTLQPQSVDGTLDDPRVQKLLLMAARNNLNSGVRMDSINLLTRNPGASDVREALMFALRYDQNPGVRLKALEGLRGYIKEDTRVRDSVLEALLTDSNPGVRSEAIGLLQPVSGDSSVRQTLQELAAGDKNTYIRSESRRLIGSLPDMD